MHWAAAGATTRRLRRERERERERDSSAGGSRPGTGPPASPVPSLDPGPGPPAPPPKARVARRHTGRPAARPLRAPRAEGRGAADSRRRRPRSAAPHRGRAARSLLAQEVGGAAAPQRARGRPRGSSSLRCCLLPAMQRWVSNPFLSCVCAGSRHHFTAVSPVSAVILNVGSMVAEVESRLLMQVAGRLLNLATRAFSMLRAKFGPSCMARACTRA
jgi:hypothetical protein